VGSADLTAARVLEAARAVCSEIHSTLIHRAAFCTAPEKSDIDWFNNCKPGALLRTRPEGW
jgi:hypothetical protein